MDRCHFPALEPREAAAFRIGCRSLPDLAYMRIVRIIARLNVGGPARHVVWLTRGLKPPEFDSILVAGSVPPGEEDMSYFAAECGVEPIYIEELSRELSPKDLISLVRVTRLLFRLRPDIIHTHTAKAGTIGRLAGLIYKWAGAGTLVGRPRQVRIVHTFHGHVFHSYYGRVGTAIFLFIERLLARLSTDKIVTISEQQRREINGSFRVGRPEQFAVIPLGVDLEALAPPDGARDAIRQEFGIDDREFLVTYLGRLTEIKDIPLLLKAAAACRDDLDGLRLRFLIAGDGHLRSELEKMSAAIGNGDSVIFAGNRSDVASILAASDAVALCSKNEGTPLSLIEAMASGVPVISTAVGGVIDLLGATTETHPGFRLCERGVAVDERTSEIFRNGLIYIAKNERLRRALIKNGFAFVRAGYSRSRLADDLRSLYRSITSDRVSKPRPLTDAPTE